MYKGNMDAIKRVMLNMPDERGNMSIKNANTKYSKGSINKSLKIYKKVINVEKAVNTVIGPP